MSVHGNKLVAGIEQIELLTKQITPFNKPFLDGERDVRTAVLYLIIKLFQSINFYAQQYP